MSNATRIVRRNIARLEGPSDPSDRRMRPRRLPIVKVISGTGAVTYETAADFHGGEPVILPYRCAVRARKPYRGNSDRMRGAA